MFKNLKFQGCTHLNDVAIPPSLTKIGNASFKDCKSLKELKLPDTLE